MDLNLNGDIALKTYAEYYITGKEHGRTVTVEVDPARSISEALENKPTKAFGFSFHDIVTVPVRITEGEITSDIDVVGSKARISKGYFIGGQAYTVAEIQAQFLVDPNLITRMQSEGWYKAILTSTNIWERFYQTDEIV